MITYKITDETLANKHLSAIKNYALTASVFSYVEQFSQALGLSALFQIGLLNATKFDFNLTAISMCITLPIAHFIVGQFKHNVELATLEYCDAVPNQRQQPFAVATMAALFLVVLFFSVWYGGSATMKLLTNGGGHVGESTTQATANNSLQDVKALNAKEAKEIESATANYDAQINVAKQKKQTWRVDELMTAKDKALAAIAKRYEASRATLTQLTNVAVRVGEKNHAEKKAVIESTNTLIEHSMLFVSAFVITIIALSTIMATKLRVASRMVKIDTDAEKGKEFASFDERLKYELKEMFVSVSPLNALLGLVLTILIVLISMGYLKYEIGIVLFFAFGGLLAHRNFKGKK